MRLAAAVAVMMMFMHLTPALAVEPRSAGQTTVAAAPDDRRGEEQTFLTFPEWFLVFSSAEYAEFVRTHTPDEFCFWGHIGQFWRGYASVIHETRIRAEPINWGYHVMIVVIGVSTTVEYAIRSAYETVIARIAAALDHSRTPEDDYAARAAQQYVEFIRYQPWYEFDFWTRMRGIWTSTSLVGPNMLRKWERKYALTTEYTVKAVYGWLIGIATNTAYDTPIESTSVLISRWPLCPDLPTNVRVVKRLPDSETLLALPRYEGFRAPAVALASCGAEFSEIAGNRSVILISVQRHDAAEVPNDTRLMLRQPMITQPGRERLVLIVPVDRLGIVINALKPGGMVLEHIFDY